MSEEIVPPVPAPPAAEPLRLLLPSPIGSLGLELTGTSVTRLVVSPAPRERRLYLPLSRLEASDFVDEAIGRISEYFAGVRRQIELDIDLAAPGVDGFARRVLRETMRIPYGRTRNYKEIASFCGRPSAYRQVVAILLANPIPILVPCHRVVPSKAGTGGWVGGEAKKRWLLRLERSVAG